MFNNSTAHPSVTTETPSDDRFDWQLSCILWHLRNETVSYDQANDACSMYKSPGELAAGTKVFYWLTAIFIIIPNSAMLLGIVGTRKLHKPLYFYLANLAVTDLLASIALLCQSVNRLGMGEGVAGLYAFMNILTLFIYSQLMSASALALLSIDSYVAIRHPIYFHTHAHSAKRNAGIAIASSWIVLSLLAFSPSMGWNCLDMPTLECYHFFSRPFAGLIYTIIFLFGSIILFTNTSVYVAIKQRQKNRLGQPGQVQPPQDNNPAQNVAGNVQPQNAAQNEADRKFQRSVEKARTVLIHVVVACIFLIIPLVLTPICDANAEKCPIPAGPHLFLVFLAFNAIINPIVSIVRTTDLRNAIRENLVAIQQALLTMIRGNRVNPQNEQHIPGNALELQAATAGGSTQNTAAGQASEGHRKTVVNQTVGMPETDPFKTGRQNLAVIEV
ncbi:sphingosine 1-phosphate receptor 1-like [Branchiostoma floridae x Branchiostoma belcheri]